MFDYSGVRTMTAHQMTEVDSRHPVRQAFNQMDQTNQANLTTEAFVCWLTSD